MAENRPVTKLLAYLHKRQDFSPSEFAEHWETRHAPIARGLENILSYRQNRVLYAGETRNGQEYSVSGIAELWFDGELDTFTPAHRRAAHDLINDEPQFLEGLTGAMMHTDSRMPDWPFKVWLLARWRKHITPESKSALIAELREVIVSRCGISNIVVDTIDETAHLLRRPNLATDAAVPHVAFSLGTSQENVALKLCRTVEIVGEEHLSVIERVQCVVVDELRII